MTRCTYCRVALEDPKALSSAARSRDHVKPKCDGGRTTVAACRRCNNEKADLYLDEWIERLRAVGDKRAKHIENVALLHPRLRKRPEWSTRGMNWANIDEMKPHYCTFCQRRFVDEHSALQHAKAIRHSPSPKDCIDAIVAL